MKDYMFWQSLDLLLESNEIIIDRPKHSRHPRYPECIYPLDYGYLKGTMSTDGCGVDVWVGSEIDIGINAIVCIADVVKQEVGIKVLLGCTPDEQEEILAFHNRYAGMRGLLIRRH